MRTYPPSGAGDETGASDHVLGFGAQAQEFSFGSEPNMDAKCSVQDACMQKPLDLPGCDGLIVPESPHQLRSRAATRDVASSEWRFMICAVTCP
jgi:hypothetical protein